MDSFSIYLTVFGGLLLAGVTGLIIWNTIRGKSGQAKDRDDLDQID